jgi:hypothetical protein
MFSLFVAFIIAASYATLIYWPDIATFIRVRFLRNTQD